MFDGGAGLAQRGVELDLAEVEVDAGESLYGTVSIPSTPT